MRIEKVMIVVGRGVVVDVNLGPDDRVKLGDTFRQDTKKWKVIGVEMSSNRASKHIGLVIKSVNGELPPVEGEAILARADWDNYFMNIAHEVATRATCDRKHVGAVLVRDRTILSTGYNGSIRGTPHCDDVGHLLVNDPERGGPSCVRTVHAEANAISQAAMNGVAIKAATVYTTASPCWNCFKLIANSGITRIVFGELYRDVRIGEFAETANIELVNLYGKQEHTGEMIQHGK